MNLGSIFVGDLVVGQVISSDVIVTNLKDNNISDRVMFYNEEDVISEVVMDESIYSIKALDNYEGWYVSTISNNQVIIKPYDGEQLKEVVQEEIEDPFLTAPSNPNTIDSIYIIIACAIAVVFSLVYSVIKVKRTTKYDI